jgi:peptide/nickel transport system substrate-binding protein
LNYISGPTVEILNTQLLSATEESYIPYAPTLSQFMTEDEVATRYENLTEFFRRRGHFWIGTGPYFLQRAFPVEGTVILERFEDYPDPANKWDRFAAPALAVAEVDGPGRVTIGEEATFDVFVDDQSQDVPYAVDDIQEVKYLVFNATNELVSTGSAEAAEDGLWQVTLDSDLTSSLEAGSNRLEVVVISKLVALPSLGSFEFVTAP